MSLSRSDVADAARRLRPVRTELEVAADVLMRLFDQGVLRTDPKLLATVAHLTGVPVDAIRRAKDRADRRGYRPPVDQAAVNIGEAPVSTGGRPGGTRISEPAREAYKQGRAKGSASAATKKSRQPKPGQESMECRGCGNSLLVSQFAKRTDRPGMRWTICQDCRKERSRDRYLSVAKERALNAARLTFILSELDEKIGLGCVDCGEPFRPGDHVTGVAQLHHVNCPERG